MRFHTAGDCKLFIQMVYLAFIFTLFIDIDFSIYSLCGKLQGDSNSCCSCSQTAGGRCLRSKTAYKRLGFDLSIFGSGRCPTPEKTEALLGLALEET